MKTASGELTRVVARSLGAETTTVPIEDAAELMECSLVDRKCLEAITRSVGVKTIVFGRIERGDDGTVVKLTTFDVGKGESQRSIEITGDTVDAMGDSLRDALDAKPAPTALPPRVIEAPLPAQPSGGVTTGTWAMIVGGGGTLAVGVGFVVSANKLQRQVQQAPTATRTDIQNLVALETAGRQRMQIGSVLAAVGGVVTTIGVIRMVVQKRRARPDEPRLDVVPESGGASVVFSMGWR